MKVRKQYVDQTRSFAVSMSEALHRIGEVYCDPMSALSEATEERPVRTKYAYYWSVSEEEDRQP